MVTCLCAYFSPWQQIGVMLIGTYKDNLQKIEEFCHAKGTFNVNLIPYDAGNNARKLPPLTFHVINLLDWSMSCDLLVGVVYWKDQDSV